MSGRARPGPTALADRGIGFRSLTEQIDTTTFGGKLIFHVFRALAEFERDLIRERTNARLAAARARGRTGGRPKALADPKKRVLAQVLYDGGQTDIATICQTLGVSRATLYRSLKLIQDQISIHKRYSTNIALRFASQLGTLFIDDNVSGKRQRPASSYAMVAKADAEIMYCNSSPSKKRITSSIIARPCRLWVSIVCPAA